MLLFPFFSHSHFSFSHYVVLHTYTLSRYACVGILSGVGGLARENRISQSPTPITSPKKLAAQAIFTI